MFDLGKVAALVEKGGHFEYFVLLFKEGHGAMIRAWSSAHVAACRAGSNPAWCRIFREISCFSPLNLGTWLRWCVLGQDTSPSNASIDSGGMSTW